MRVAVKTSNPNSQPAERSDQLSSLELDSAGWFRTLDRRQAIESEEIATSTRRLLIGVRLAAIAWFCFVLVDWVVVTYISPGSFLYFLILRLVPGVVMLSALVLLERGHTPSKRTLVGIDAAVAMTTAVSLSVLGLKHGGITSPYVHGITLVLIAESITMPVHWREGVWLKAAIVASFPVVALVASTFQPEIAAQLGSSTALALFAENLFFVAAAGLFVIVSGHVTWVLRRQVFESKVIDRYRLKERIEVGGMSEVWSAYHFALKRDVAVKIMQAPDTGRNAALSRFEREVEALTTLEHPNAVRVFDFGISGDGLVYFVMELLDGETLGSLVRREGSVSPHQAVQLVRQACGALAEAHQKGIVHRDVKPDNLFLTRLADGQYFVKVVDFGIAKLTNPETQVRITGEGWIGGTPEYMSPEASSGQEVGPETDIYALGAVLYFLLTGSPPFTAANPVEMLLAHVNVDPAPPSTKLQYTLPDELEQLILRCLSKDPAERYADAQELASALDLLGPQPSIAPRAEGSSKKSVTAITIEQIAHARSESANRVETDKAS